MASKSRTQAREKYLEFQLLQQQLEQLTKYIEELESKQAEFLSTKENLSELSASRIGSEVFMPVAHGIFAKATLSSSEELLVNVGADIAVAKPMPEVVNLIDRQIAEVKEIRVNIHANIEKLTERLNTVMEELESFS